MKRRVAIGLIIGLALVGITSISAAKSGILQKYLDKDIEAVNTELSMLDKEQLVQEMNAVAKEADDINNLIPFATEITKKKSSFSETELLTFIKDKNQSIPVQELFVDLYLSNYEGKPLPIELKTLLLSKDISQEVKTRIIATANFQENDIEILKKLIIENDDSLAFHSLKKLSQVDKKDAHYIAMQILSNNQNTSTDKTSAALKAGSVYIQSLKGVNRTEENQIKDFLKIAMNFIDSSDETTIKDSALFALSDIGGKEVIQLILNNPHIDFELKVFTIDQNYRTLQSILTHNPTEDEIQLIIQAMEVLPIVDLIDDLTAAIPTIEDKELQNRAYEVVQLMKTEGIKGNEKWIDQK